jgi:hypothetical protein
MLLGRYRQEILQGHRRPLQVQDGIPGIQIQQFAKTNGEISAHKLFEKYLIFPLTGRFDISIIALHYSRQSIRQVWLVGLAITSAC